MERRRPEAITNRRRPMIWGVVGLTMVGCTMNTGDASNGGTVVSEPAATSSALMAADAAHGSGTPGGHRDPGSLTRRKGLLVNPGSEKRVKEQAFRRLADIKLTALAAARLRSEGASPVSADVVGAQPLGASAVVPFGEDLIAAAAAPVEGAPTTTAASPRLAAAATLPAAVDNSKLASFPPIRNQQGNTCVAFAVGYYQLTHEFGLANGWDNTNPNDNSTKLSPRWIYNLANGGGDSGTDAYSVLTLASRHGMATWSEFPFNAGSSDPLEYRAWPTDSNVWLRALRFRKFSWGGIANANKPEGLDQIKQVLLNGHIVTFGTRIDAWNYSVLGNDPSTSVDDAFVGQHIAQWDDGVGAGYHELTIVGYNDNLWTDLNGNGKVDPYEKGALKIANSWGTEWMNAGFVWVSYDAIFDESRVAGGPGGGNRKPILWAQTLTDSVQWLAATPSQTPKLVARFTVSHPRRGQLGITLDTADPDHPYAGGSIWDFLRVKIPAFDFNGGDYAFDGTTNPDLGPVTFYVDATDNSLASFTALYSLGVQNRDKTSAAGITSFALIDNVRGRTVFSSAAPKTAPVSSYDTSLPITYRFEDATRTPQLASTPAALDFGIFDPSYTWGTGQWISLKNLGTGATIVSGLTAQNPIFSFDMITFPFLLAPGESRDFMIDAKPIAVGKVESSVLLNTVNGTPYSLPVTITGQHRVDISATIDVPTNFAGGYCANVTVKNLGYQAATTWSLGLNLKQSAFTDKWSAVFTPNGESTYTVTPMSWNASLDANGVNPVVFGFCANKTGSDWMPVITSASGE